MACILFCAHTRLASAGRIVDHFVYSVSAAAIAGKANLSVSTMVCKNDLLFACGLLSMVCTADAFQTDDP